MATALTLREIPLGDPGMRDFVRFHWRHFHGNAHWVPQLNGDLLGNRLLGLEGLLTPRHPYHRTAHATHFLALRGREAVGRVSVVTHDRFDAHHGTRMAFFGFFETIDDVEVARALLGAAADWARSRGATTLRGPGEYANVTHERQGCLVEGFEEDVLVEHTWNPPYYARLIEACGFVKSMDYRAYRIDLTAPLSPKLIRVADAVVGRDRIRTRPLDLAHLDADLRLVVDIYNGAWAHNWGFLPIESWEVDALVHQLRPIVDPGLVRFAFEGTRPVAVLGAFPDPNVLLRPRWRWYGDGDLVRLARLVAGRRRIDRIRVMFFGIVPGFRGVGADALLYRETHAYALRRGYVGCDMSLLLEVNAPMVRIAESMGARRYKTWRIWDLPLDA
jgi:GNAT superfamily N-acetyltransferase